MFFNYIDIDCDWKAVGDYIVSSEYELKTDIDNLISKILLFVEDDIPSELLWGPDGMIRIDLVKEYVEENGGLSDFDYY